MMWKKLIVRLRMWYADIRGHHGKRWNYEPEITREDIKNMEKNKKKKENSWLLLQWL